jgi:TolB-like protein
MRRTAFLYLSLVFFILTTCINVHAAASLEDGVNQLADQISKSMLEKQSKKIAIIDFSDLNGNVTALGQFLAEELTTQLFLLAPGKFEVVERRQLLRLQEELALNQKGFIEEKSLKKMGQMLGVDAIVTGSMTDLGNTVKINARLIGVESARVFAVAAADIPKTGPVTNLIAKTAQIQQTTTKTPAIASSGREVQTRQSEEYKDFFFELQSCKNSGHAITCLLLITNKDKDRNLTMGSPGWGNGVWVDGFGCTRIIDDSGEEHCATSIKLGNRSIGQWEGSTLAADVPTKANIRFEGSSSNIANIALLEILCRANSTDTRDNLFKVQFRNISLMR